MNAAEPAVLRASDARVDRWRADFPILRQTVRGKPLVYLDNAATTQKPQAVIDAEVDYYREVNANVHRGVHWMSQRATDRMEAAREKIRRFLNAGKIEEIVFTSGTTESINLVSSSFGGSRLKAGDEVLISAMEHHANIVPWQIACERAGAKLKVVPIDDDGEFLFDEYLKLLGPRTRIVAVVHISNALGTVNPVKRIVEAAHARGVPVLLDGAQAVAHTRVDVQDLGCDFYAFSGHKIYGPTGTGVLYGRQALLDAMPPYKGGGDMIRTVTFEKSTWAGLPAKFEAGTPNIAGAIGLGAALDYLESVGLEAAAAHEHELLEYGTARLTEIEGLRLIGTAREKAGILSFVMDGIHPHDIGTILDHEAVAVRTGHHCAMPVMDRYGVPATARASLALYNTREEIDALVRAIHKAKELFG